MIDLRSDTVTRPTPPMLAAMSRAQVGDDVMRDDPSVQALEAHVAELTGKAGGLFFPTGTQSNLVALMAHCQRGDEYIVGQTAHTYKYEGGGAAVLGSIQPQPIDNADDGSLPIEKIRAAIKADDAHFARTRLITLENTFNGKVVPQQMIQATHALAREKQLAFHLDGARACNAAVASGMTLENVCEGFDSVSICLSKGLGAPVGSVLVGPHDFLARARRIRKMVGGGMRQSGYLAAAGQYAITHQFTRLEEDHRRCERLAEALRAIDEIDVRYQATNMMFFDAPADRLAALEAHLKTQGVIISAGYGGSIRLVTHLDIDDAGIDQVIAGFKSFFQRQ